jgi:putative exporter of polyketide antibiotics
MYFLVAAAVIIFIALILRFWMNVNAEEGFLGKGLMIIVAVLVVVGILSLFGLVPNFR